MPRVGNCSSCGEHQSDLDAHRRVVHQPKCKVTIPGSSAVKVVYKDKDTGQFQCPGCDYSFPSPPPLQMHVRTSCKGFSGRMTMTAGAARVGSAPYGLRRRGRLPESGKSIRGRPPGRNKTRVFHPPVVSVDCEEDPNADLAKDEIQEASSNIGLSDDHELDPDYLFPRRGRARADATFLVPRSSHRCSNDAARHHDQLPISSLSRVEKGQGTLRNRSVASSMPSSFPGVSEPEQGLLARTAAQHTSGEALSLPIAQGSSRPLLDGALAVHSFLAGLARDLSNELLPAFEAFGCKTSQDLDVLCLMDPKDDWGILRDYLEKHHKVEFLCWVIITAGLETRRASLPAPLPAAGDAQSGSAPMNAVCMWLSRLRRPLLRRAPLFYECGLREARDLDALCMLEAQWDPVVKDEMLRKGLSLLEWLVIRDGLKSSVSSMQSR
ncbi:hypothetical protein SCP_0102300 [Sparassis crispa]|uniref:Uncharacterized protein n=1 Tax=Sparassis crispa TaxID=139825 RepID=A0A401G5B8_9APHY|nr:hypothetical protein SCP_0102300 [Sparassis crispa]GBE77357.1 hypothetical protein SCP_0102300 [Sparassis crispa]